MYYYNSVPLGSQQQQNNNLLKLKTNKMLNFKCQVYKRVQYKLATIITGTFFWLQTFQIQISQNMCT